MNNREAFFMLCFARHCEGRSNPRYECRSCKMALPIWDCFVPRNDAFGFNAF